MIDNGPKPLASSSGVIRSGVNLGQGSILASNSLIKGQIVEGVVVQLQPRLLVETPKSMFSAAINENAYTLGERLLFKVIDAKVQPPRLELLRYPLLPGSLLAQQSVFLRSLLYRPKGLNPLQQWLSNSALNTKLPSVLATLLKQFWQLPNTPTYLDIKKWLLMSGLFSENRGKADSLTYAMMGPTKANNDLKALLQLLSMEASLEQQVKPLLEALHSSQVKGLDALVNHQLYYQWLMPWFGQQNLLLTLQQNQQQRSQKQWSITLTHQGLELGDLQINLLLTEAIMAQNAEAHLHFSSDTQWLGPLITGTHYKLHAALKAHGITLKHISVGPKEDEKANPKAQINHTILDVRV